MKSLMAHFLNVFDYLFNAEWNPEYANAAHIKISRSTDSRYPNEIRIAAIDSDGEIHSLCAYDADFVLEPMSVEYEPLEDDCPKGKQMKNHTQESLEEAKMQGVWDREDRKPIQDHYGDDGELNDAYLAGYDPKGEIVPFKQFCPNCADQASIAAPGETVLCKTHSDENHYAEMKEFFIEEIERLQFKSLLPFCSACGTDKRVVYVGLIPTKNSGILSFSFCVDCRDELTLKKNAAIAAQERIGA